MAPASSTKGGWLDFDGGSHAYAHQLATFNGLFGQPRDGGIYACEDLCTSYWKEQFDGGVGEPGTPVEFLKSLVDELNGWFWRPDFGADTASVGRNMQGLHFYPGLVVIEKRRIRPGACASAWMIGAGGGRWTGQAGPDPVGNGQRTRQRPSSGRTEAAVPAPR